MGLRLVSPFSPFKLCEYTGLRLDSFQDIHFVLWLPPSFSSFKLCKYKSLPEGDVKPPRLSPAHPGQGVVVLCTLLFQSEKQGGENLHGWDVSEDRKNTL